MRTTAIGPIAIAACLALLNTGLIAGCGQTSTLGRLPARGQNNDQRPADRTSDRPGATAAPRTTDTETARDAEARTDATARAIPADWTYPAGPRTKRMYEYDPNADGFDLNNPGTPTGVVVRRITDPDAQGGTDDFRVLVERIRPTINDPLIRTTDLRIADDGEILLTAVSSAKDEREGGDKRHFRYQPPLGLAPPTLEPGGVYESSAEMIEHNEGDPSSVVLKGDAERTFRTLGRDEIEQLFGTDAPDLPGVLEVLEISIGPAKVDQRVARLVKEGVGAVRELDERTVKVFGFTTESRSVLFIVDEHSAGDTRE